MGTVYRINTLIISLMTAASIEEPSSITREIWRTPTHIAPLCVRASSRAPPFSVRPYLSVSGGKRGGGGVVCVYLCEQPSFAPDARSLAAIRGGKMEPRKDRPHLLTDLLFLPSSSPSFFPSLKQCCGKKNGSFVRGGQTIPSPPTYPRHPTGGQHWHYCWPARRPG